LSGGGEEVDARGSGEAGEDFENTGDGDTEPEYKELVDRFAVEAALYTWVYGEAQNQEGDVRLAAAERGVW
jgi:hypothetical protein